MVCCDGAAMGEDEQVCSEMRYRGDGELRCGQRWRRGKGDAGQSDVVVRGQHNRKRRRDLFVLKDERSGLVTQPANQIARVSVADNSQIR